MSLFPIPTFTEFQGPKYCCADDPVSFHYVSEERMYEMDYLIYRVGQSLAENKFTQSLDETREKISRKSPAIVALSSHTRSRSHTPATPRPRTHTPRPTTIARTSVAPSGGAGVARSRRTRPPSPAGTTDTERLEM